MLRPLGPLLVLCALAASVVPAAAMPATTLTQGVVLHRTAGTCPPKIAVTTVTQPYEGGARFEWTAQTMAVAYAAQIVSVSSQSARFSADLHPSFASCAAKGHSGDGLHAFTLAGGKLTYILQFGTIAGPNASPGVLSMVSVETGPPHVRYAISD